jgi:hypothetical protein
VGSFVGANGASDVDASVGATRSRIEDSLPTCASVLPSMRGCPRMRGRVSSSRRLPSLSRAAAVDKDRRRTKDWSREIIFILG